MKYTKIGNAEQQQMLENRLTQYEQEHYNHVVNRDLSALQASTAKEDRDKEAHTKAVEDAEKAMAILDAAHAETVKKLAEVKAKSTVKP